MITRLLEVTVFALVNFFPYLFLSVLPFEKRLRYTKKTTNILVASFAGAQVLLAIFGAFIWDGHGAINIVSMALDGLLCLLIIDAHFGKKLFVFLMLCNVSNFVVAAAEYFESVFYPKHADELYGWTFTFLVVVLQAVLLPFIYFLMQGKVRQAANAVNVNLAWWYLWFIPATFFLVWFSHLYTAVDEPTRFQLDGPNVLFLFLINLGAFFVYYMVFLLIREQEKSFHLEEHNYALAMQAVQYENLHEKIREARQAKHDIRHHVSVMLSYIDEKDYDGLKAYLKTYRQSLPDDSKIEFCSHRPINALLLYFAQLSKTNDVDFVVNLRLPDVLGVAENDLSVVLGNLLENAMDACLQQTTGERKIIVGANYDGSSLYFTVDNTFENEIKLDKHGAFLSTKHEGLGTGTDSVKRIAERYRGSLTTEWANGLFTASVVLKKSE